MKIVVSGASGLVGAAVAQQAAAAGHTVIGLIGTWTGRVPGATVLQSFDLADPARAAHWVAQTRPDAIINAAAFADPASCEKAPELSHSVNVTWPTHLAQAAIETGARLVHISSEQVFDGVHAPFAPTSECHPFNLYGRQKLESEQAILAIAPGSIVVRPPLLVGNSLSGHRSLHEKMLELWAGGGVARLFGDEFRQVCSAENLAAVLIELAERRDLRGPVHWAGADLVSRFELGRRLAEKFHAPAALLTEVWRSANPAVAAKRPANLALDLAPLDRELRTHPQPLNEAIRGLRVPSSIKWPPAVPS